MGDWSKVIMLVCRAFVADLENDRLRLQELLERERHSQDDAVRVSQ
jgi:hypothetical protein